MMETDLRGIGLMPVGLLSKVRRKLGECIETQQAPPEDLPLLVLICMNTFLIHRFVSGWFC